MCVSLFLHFMNNRNLYIYLRILTQFLIEKVSVLINILCGSKGDVKRGHFYFS